MKTTFYLIISDSGSVRTVKQRPDVKWNEVAIQQTVELPNALFQKPQITASIVIPEEMAGPKVITSEVQDNIRNSIIENTGLDVKITIE